MNKPQAANTKQTFQQPADAQGKRKRACRRLLMVRMPSNEMMKLLLILMTTMFVSCQKTNDTEQVDGIASINVQTPEDEAYAKEFVEKATNSQGLLLPKIGSLIKDKQTTIAVAEAILFKVYGEENIKKQRPYGVYKTEHYWVLTGKLPEGYRGGVFEIALDANDGRVIGLTHGK